MRFSVAWRPTAALFLVPLLATLCALPALAGNDPSAIQPASVSHKPDASIRMVSSSYHPCQWVSGTRWCSEPAFSYTWNPSYFVWHGVGVFNTTGTNQVVNADFQNNCCDEIHTFSVSIRNDGSTSDRFTVHAAGSGLTGWKVAYFNGTTKVTSAVVAGTFKTPVVAPGGHFLLKVRMSGTFDTETLAGYRLITVASSADPTKKDAVRLQLEYATWCHC